MKFRYFYSYARNIYHLFQKYQFHSACFPLQNQNISEMRNELISLSKKLDSIPKINALDKVNADNVHFLNEIGPLLKKSFNLAAYVNSSETLQKLVKLNVDLSIIDKDVELASFIVKCDFKTDIEPYILFLLDNGVPLNDVGYVLTKNPYLLTIPLKDLQTKINYFMFRKFDKQDVTSILIQCPRVFNLKIQTIDQRLAYLIQEYLLTPENIRCIVRKSPKIILLENLQIKKCTFTFQEEMGFNLKEIKSIILRIPSLWVKSNKSGLQDVLLTFEYVHNTMQIPHEQILRFPLILLQRISFIKGKHLYLKLLDRAQYDPTKPLYVPLSAFCDLDDSEFCLNYAKTSVIDFNKFLKTI